MKEIEQFITPLIESQFPSFYREEGTNFIKFVKSYYEWLEQSNNTLFHTRNALSYRDIDRTVDDFIVHFKEASLRNIQFTTASNKRLFIKNALDFYRSKGTERSVDLFFKLIYGEDADVYYPGDDIFKLSDGIWNIPTYLEISNADENINFSGKQLTGISSGATAFVEAYVIKKKTLNVTDNLGNPENYSKNIYVLFISNLNGNFQTGEKITYNGISDISNAPIVVGSLTSVEVITGGSNYAIGDKVLLQSNTGFQGKAIVTDIEDVTGQVSFQLVNGGWGFTTTPKIIISDKVLTVNNIKTYDQTLHVVNIDTDQFNIGDEVYQANATVEWANGIVTAASREGDTLLSNTLLTIANTNGSFLINERLQTRSTSANGNVDDIKFVALDKNKPMQYFEQIVQPAANIIFYALGGTFANGFANGDQIVNYNIDGSIAGTGKIISVEQNLDSGNGQMYVSLLNGTLTANAKFYKTGNAVFANTLVYDDKTASANVMGISSNSKLFVTSITTSNSFIKGEEVYQVNGSIETANGVIDDIIRNGANVTLIISNTDGLFKTGFPILGRSSFSNGAVDNYETTIGIYDISSTGLSSITIEDGGTGFTNNEFLVVTPTNGGSGAEVRVATTNSTGGITSLTIKERGTGYIEVPVISKSPSSEGSGAILAPFLGNEFDYENGLYAYAQSSLTTCNIIIGSAGSLASFRVTSLDNEQTVQLNTDYLNSNNIYGADFMDIVIDSSGNSAFSGSNAYGFPSNPIGNLTSGSISSMLDFDTKTIGTISGIGLFKPGEDYNTTPFITVIEPGVYSFKKEDIILTTQENTSRFVQGEDILYVSRKSFDANSDVDEASDFINIFDNKFVNGDVIIYFTDTGNTAVGGLANNQLYYTIQANTSGIKLSPTSTGTTPVALTKSSGVGQYIQKLTYETIGTIKEIANTDTLIMTSTTLFGGIQESGETYIRGGSSGFTSKIINVSSAQTFSGFNAEIDAAVVTADGAVSPLGLRIVDSGFGYEPGDILEFSKENDTVPAIGLCKAVIQKQGQSEGFFENTKGFLSQDKYLHDNDYYQDYSYEILSRVPFDKYSEMIKKVLHTAGTRFFGGVRVTSVTNNQITASSTITVD